MDNNELTHWGIKGMRWGVRRYQTKDGKLTPAGKKRYDKDVEKLKAENAKLDMQLKTKKAQDKATSTVQKLQAERERKKRELETGIPDDPENREAARLRAIKSGSAKDALNFKGELTQQEMQYIENRLRWEKNMSNITAEEVSRGKAGADKFFNGVEDVTKKVNTGIKAWNTFANVYNAFSSKEISLPKISTNIDVDNRAIRKKEKEKKAEKEKEAKAAADQKRKEDGQKQVDDYNAERERKQAEKDRINSGTYHYKYSKAKEESGQSYVSGYLEAPKQTSKETTSRGQSYVAGLLGRSESNPSLPYRVEGNTIIYDRYDG